MNPQVLVPVVSSDEKRAFRLKFQHSLQRCLQKGFSVEECFGIIWEETLEQIGLSDSDQRALFSEMIDWARNRRLS